ncbi:MAG: HutD family protein [Burkholderiales bacterium]
MPWKNGGGSTAEIAVSPHGADLAGFAWRASIAQVECDGPFSAFPGIDRTLVLLAGHGMRLTAPDATTVLRAPWDMMAFAGEQAMACELCDGPTRDFNLMVRRDAMRGAVVVVRATPRTLKGFDALLCFAALGAVECTVDAQPPIVLPPEHTLVLEDAAARGRVDVCALAPDGAALVCTMTDARRAS